MIGLQCCESKVAVLLRISCPFGLAWRRVETYQLPIFVALFALFALSYPPGQDSFLLIRMNIRQTLELSLHCAIVQMKL
jgi:hypothetical protein